MSEYTNSPPIISECYSYSLNFLKPKTLPSRKPQHTPPFPFLSLPAELRLLVYSHLLPPCVLISPPRPAYEKSARPWAIASVSRQLRQEVLSFVYSNTIFYIGWHTRAAYREWIEELDEYLGWLVNHVVVYGIVEIERLGRTKRVAKVSSEVAYPGERRSATRWTILGDDYSDDSEFQRNMEEIYKDWRIRWMKRDIEGDELLLRAIIEVLEGLECRGDQRGGSGGFGLGKDAIRTFVDCFCDDDLSDTAFAEKYGWLVEAEDRRSG
ncbi:MAG: hypothetical protein Q9186_006532 [Xanthomendoza sp. 1 TL-2023]